MLFICFFIFLLNIKLNFFPYYGNLVLAFLGLVFFILNNKYEKTNKSIFYLFLFLLMTPFIYVLSLLYNQTTDFYFLKTFFINNIVFLFSAFFIYYFLFKNNNYLINYNNFILTTSQVILVQLVVSVLVYIFPALFDLVFSIISAERDSDTLQNFNESRMVGVGISFFGAGVVYSLALVLLADYLTRNKSKFVLLVYFLTVVVGMVISRTTVIGLFFSLLIVLWNFKYNLKLICGLFIAASALVLILVPIVNSNQELEKIMNFGFSFLFDYKNSQASQSVGVLFDMFGILPSKLSTWLIGDAMFGDQNSYYKDTDVGYLRIIFASGLIGLASFISIHIYMLFKIRKDLISNFSKFLIFLMFLVLNFKGVSSFFVLLILPFLFSIYYKKGLGND